MKVWKIKSEEQFFSQIIKCNQQELINALSKKEKEKYYGRPISIPKKNGKREIYAIDKSTILYKIQRNLIDNFLINIMVSDVNFGYVKKCSYCDYLSPHTDFYGSSGYLRLDIKNFFGSITKDVLKSTFEYYCDIENDLNNSKKNKIIEYIIDILMYNGVVIQGAATSPIVSNIVFRELDIRILKYCRCFGINYSRYVDDLLFSGSKCAVWKNSFISGISKILSVKNFKINYQKVIRSQNYISLNGYVISNSIKLSRNKLSEINRILFYLENKNNLKRILNSDISELNILIKEQTGLREDRFDGKYEIVNYLTGYRAFIINIIKFSEDQNFLLKANKIIKRIESSVDCLLK